MTESLTAAERLAAVAPPGDGLSRLLVDAAQRHAALPEADAAALLAALPVFTRPEGQQPRRLYCTGGAAPRSLRLPTRQTPLRWAY